MRLCLTRYRLTVPSRRAKAVARYSLPWPDREETPPAGSTYLIVRVHSFRVPAWLRT